MRTALCGTGETVLGEMRDSSSILQDSISDRLRGGSGMEQRKKKKIETLLRRLQSDGYLLLRNFLDREEVLRARQAILEHLDAEGYLASGSPLDDAEIADETRLPSLLNRQDIAHQEEILAVLESPRLATLFRDCFDEPAATYPYKWLRAVPRGKFTGVHVDSVYMGRICPQLLTAWIPLGDINVAQGTLVVSPASHRLEALREVRETYGQSSVGKDGVQSGWLTDNPKEVNHAKKWVTCDFRAGDVCILSLDILHLSSTNTTTRFRLSCDTRWQPASMPMNPRLTAGGGTSKPITTTTTTIITTTAPIAAAAATRTRKKRKAR